VCNTANCNDWRDGGNTIEVTWNTPGNGSIIVEERIGDAGPVGSDTKNFVIYKQPDSFTSSVQDDIICYNTSTNIVVENSENGVTYQLQLASDSSPVGTPVAGTGGNINLSTGALTEDTEFTILAYNLGCELVSSSVEVEVIPEINSYTITPDVTNIDYCEGEGGVEIGLTGSDLGVNYYLYNGGTLEGGAVAGTGGTISFGPKLTGSYTVEAIHSLDLSESCSQLMNGNLNVSELPAPEVNNQTGTICSDESGDNLKATIVLSDYETVINNSADVAYSWFLSDGTTPVSTPAGVNVAGTFEGSTNIVKTYYCVVTDNSSGCESTATVEITIWRVPETGPQYHISNEYAK
jgi:hypothetical protein